MAYTAEEPALFIDGPVVPRAKKEEYIGGILNDGGPSEGRERHHREGVREVQGAHTHMGTGSHPREVCNQGVYAGTCSPH